MSVPLSISRRSSGYASSPTAGAFLSSSPPGSTSWLNVAGASPPSLGHRGSSSDSRSNPYAAAKKFWKRLCFDGSLDPTEYRIGFIETVQQPERRSGVEAWSMRVHDRLVELPFGLFCARFQCAGGLSGGLGSTSQGGVCEDLSAFAVSGVPNEGRGSGDGSWAGAEGAPVSPRYTSGASGSAAAVFAHCQPAGEELFVGSFGSGSAPRQHGDVPFHRIAYFKHHGTIVWESEQHKRRAAEHAAEAGACGRGRASGARDGLPPLMPLPHLGAPAGTPGGGNRGTGGASGGAAAACMQPRSPKGASPEVSDSDSGECEGASDTDAGEALSGGDAGEGEDGGAAAGEVPPLPEACWMLILRQLAVRDVCMVGRTSQWLRQLAGDHAVWTAQYEGLWGEAPQAGWNTAMVRRTCRRSELKAARWLEAELQPLPMGCASTGCLQLDDTKVVSADGSAVRLWSHATGRRIATLQGHAARVMSVAFDEELIVSGDTSSIVKLWGMDDLRCRRTLRGHEGAVTCVGLLANGIPLSGSEDSTIKIWDVQSGSAIMSLASAHPVLAMQGHGASGQLVSAGWGVQLWDVSAAALRATLDDGPSAGPAGARAQHPFSCVSYTGELVAAGRAGEVVLFDPRVAAPVGRLRHGGDGAAAGGAAAACGWLAGKAGMAGGAAAMGHPVGDSGPLLGSVSGLSMQLGGTFNAGAAAAEAAAAPPSCVGVQLDDWKLVTGFRDGSNQLHVYDIRALSKGHGSTARGVWQRPLMTLAAPARINAFQYHEQTLLAGLEGQECLVWRFERPSGIRGHDAHASAPEPTTPASQRRCGGGGPSSGGAGSGAGTAEGGRDRKEKKTPRVKKQQGRYPKRSTK